MLSRLESELGVSVNEKARTASNGDMTTMYCIRTIEANIEKAYCARERILGEHPQFTGDVGDFLPEDPFRQPNEVPVSPDPDESPIAHSLLTGAKNISRINQQSWKAPGTGRPSNRDQMRMKANRAILGAPIGGVRLPTNMWSGYGFSSSLPADILKNVAESKVADNKKQNSDLPALTCVLEDDEQLDELAPCESFAVSIRQRPQPRKNYFSASTSVFDAVASTFEWDIRIFNDPSMVLAQLGCSEYLAQFREQEIDMEAFLLLDEDNLKDIGVATIGARKKLKNAILKLRESADMHHQSTI